MTKIEIIKKIMENKEPDQNLCPELWLNYYDNKGLGVRKNANTGEIIYQREYESLGKKWPSRWEVTRINGNRSALIFSPRMSVETTDMKNWKIGGENVLEIASITIDAHRGLGARDWKFLDPKYYWVVPRIFLFSGDPHVYNSDGSERHPEEMKTFNHYFVKVDLHHLQTLASNGTAAEEARKFFGADEAVYPWNVRNYYKKSVKKPKKDNPMDKIANREYEWPDLSDYPLYETIDRQRYYVGTTVENNKVVQCVYVDGYIVVRNLERYCAYDTNIYDRRREYKEGKRYLCNEDISQRRERSRIVVSPKGQVGLYVRGWGRNEKIFERSSSRISYTYSTGGRDDQYVYIGFENLAKIDKTRYLVPVIEKVAPGLKLQVLVNAIRHPILEQMYKAGFEEIANYLNEDDEVAGRLKNVFNVKERKTPLNKLLDMNTYQLKVINEKFTKLKDDRFKWNVKNYLLCVAKQLANVETFASLSKDTTNELFDAAEALISANLWYQDLRGERLWYYWRNRYEWDCDITSEEARGLVKICKMCKNNEQNIRMYVDTIKLYLDLPDTYRPNIDIYGIDNFRSLEIIHDDLIQITNVYKEEYRKDREGKIAEGFAKRYAKTVERYGEDNGEFMIKAPEKPAELTTEGSILGHCVGGYLERVGMGGTTILFLRRKEFSSTPFYTIQVSGNEKEKHPRLVQVHGYHNCWLGNNPEVIPFVKAWLDSHNIAYDKRILLCTSEGYGSNGQYLDGVQFGL